MAHSDANLVPCLIGGDGHHHSSGNTPSSALSRMGRVRKSVNISLPELSESERRAITHTSRHVSICTEMYLNNMKRKKPEKTLAKRVNTTLPKHHMWRLKDRQYWKSAGDWKWLLIACIPPACVCV
ncbi:hypothetical protein AVEN_141385-1 [Araneus ventricosus]|uniref:Uncharacterized protein n=1 Tax=Araneus ventricosus TaxID=182803 RepID=A0A4Y2CYE2_ARAVE|nr:hypothetical protein AVEN_141385-1 [Araneus ventricosus]